jgi:hypothetical protein
VLNVLVPDISVPLAVAVFELIVDVVIDGLPTVVPLRVVLLVSVTVRPVAFVHVELVDDFRPETKFTRAH